MKKKAYTLTQTEILGLAIQSQERACNKYYEMLKSTNFEGKEVFEEVFWKMRKLLELYELQTGNEYGFEYGYLKEMGV